MNKTELNVLQGQRIHGAPSLIDNLPDLSEARIFTVGS